MVSGAAPTPPTEIPGPRSTGPRWRTPKSNFPKLEQESLSGGPNKGPINARCMLRTKIGAAKDGLSHQGLLLSPQKGMAR